MGRSAVRQPCRDHAAQCPSRRIIHVTPGGIRLRSPVLSLPCSSPLRQACALTVAVFALGGCAATKSLLQPKIALRQVQFVVTPKANDATPFSVDLVAISDEALVPVLLAMPAAQWFDPVANVRNDYQDRVRCWSYELTPGMSMPVEDAKFTVRGVRAVLVFANYKGKGAYRVRLDATPKATVWFDDKTVRLADNP